jgi:uncharacterized cupredoxin-like copper-binding protein
MEDLSMRFKLALALLAVGFFSAMAGASGTHTGGHGAAGIIGQPGKAARVGRTITITMLDSMRYSPARVTVNKGETVRFIVKNAGNMKHELVLGTEKELQEHYEVMKKNPEMEHEDDNMVTVQPGETGEIIWHFTRAGTIGFACLLPGHYEAGMKGTVRVKTPAGKK